MAENRLLVRFSEGSVFHANGWIYLHPFTYVQTEQCS